MTAADRDEGATPERRVALRRTPPRRRRRHALLMLALGVLPAAVLPLAWFWWQRALSTEAVGGVLAVVLALGLAWLVAQFALPPPSPIVIDDDALLVPLGRQTLRFVLDELIVARRDRGDLILFAAPPGKVGRGHVGGVVVPASCFLSSEGAAQVIVDVRARLLRRGGPAHLACLDDNERRALAFHRRKPVVVWVVVGTCLAAFCGQVMTSSLSSVEGLAAVGANVSTLTARGEVWRVVTANLLHGSLLHLAMNTLALLSTGALVERWLGRAGMLVIVFVAGAGGQAMSAVVAVVEGAPRVSVGVSGAVFGVLGVLLWSTIRFRGRPIGGLRVPPSTWALLILSNAAISSIPMVDVTAHVAGFMSGAAAAALVAPRPDGVPPRLSPRARRAAAWVCFAAVALSIGALASWRVSSGLAEITGADVSVD